MSIKIPPQLKFWCFSQQKCARCQHRGGHGSLSHP